MAIAPSITTDLEFAVEFGESAQWQDTAQTTAATETDPLGSWEDQSANGYDAEQGTTSNKPTVGSDAIEFDGSSDYLEANDVAAVAATGVMSFYICFDLKRKRTDDRLFFFWNSSVVNEWIRLRQISSGNTWSCEIREPSSTPEQYNIQSGTPTLGKQVIAVILNGSVMRFYVDGVEIGSGIDYSSANALNFDRFYIAVDDGGTIQHSEIDLFGCYVYSVAHSDADRGTIEDDLTAAFISAEQNLSPDTVAFPFSVNNAEIANDSAQGLSPDTVSFPYAVNNAEIANDSEQGLSPDTVSFPYTVNTVTIANDSAQGLNPNTVSFPYGVNNAEIANDSAQGLSPDTVAFPYVINNVTIANDSAQDITIDGVTMTIENSHQVAMGIEYLHQATIEIEQSDLVTMVIE
jgi:hypothetical protein